jgi:hypothetical protein
LYRFLAIAVLLDVKDIPQVGPLQWGRISALFPVELANGIASMSSYPSARILERFIEQAVRV